MVKNKEIEFDANGNIIDFLSEKPIRDTPEERVRQNFISLLNIDYGYPKENIVKEVPIQRGSKIQTDATGGEIRADIVVYNDKKSARTRDQGNILFIAECKQPNSKDGYAQLVSYIFNTSAIGGVWTNGTGICVFRRKNGNEQGLEEILSLPRYKENWQDDEKIPDKHSLPRPHNVRFLLASCHNKLYGRGMENEDFDLAMDMVRILLAKIQDETSPGTVPAFWITEKEAATSEGRKNAANTIQKLFREYADGYPDVFEKHEKIQVGSECIAEAVGILKNWSLSARNEDADDWDLMGETYEQFTHINLKRQQGQFFTNRLVVNMMISILDPTVGDKILDPAGGSGGFATAAFRYMRQKIIQTTPQNSPQRDRQLSQIKDSVFLVEIAARLVKIAKCAMLLTGDGQSGMTRGNSLDSYSNLDQWIQSRCNRGETNSPSIIATNPPFSGQKADSQIADKTILKSFVFGHTFKKNPKGKYKFNYDKESEDENLLPRQAPEILFIERCLDWLKPGGKMGIVMPKGFLDNITYEAYRAFLLENYKLDGVVTLHKDTFQPDTGVRTCVLFFTKPKNRDELNTNYEIFMAQSQRIGQDSKGNSVFILDGNGNSTGILNHDLEEIAKSYHDFKNGAELKKSEYIFTVRKNDLRDNININPQHYSPNLNNSLNKILEFDSKEGWSTTTIGQLESGIKIYIGPRWNSSNLKNDVLDKNAETKPYLTANAALELRRFSIKYMDLSKASESQKLCIKQLSVEEGDILISRSGTIGKVTYATKDLARNYLVSDDLVRVRVRDKKLRAYLLAYFTSQTAHDLMLLDEYGSVQQHLQPRHIQEMVIPIPDDWNKVKDMIKTGNDFIKAMEKISIADKCLRIKGFDSLFY